MNDDRLREDRELTDAFRSVREAYDGTNAESNLTLQRALFRTRTRDRRQRFTRWIVLPAAAVLVASTAWAGVTGRLTPAVRSVMESLHDERPTPVSTGNGSSAALARPPSSSESLAAPVVAPTSTTEPPADPPVARALPLPSPPAESPPAALPAAPPAIEPSAHRAAAASSSATSTTSTPRSGDEAVAPHLVAAPSSTAPDPHAALFAEAHRLHFTERDPARALAAWDRYLDAAPNGRFAPEARYNRALALVRLGRRVEAQKELSAFATGAYGDYRRDDAKALLDALARDASRP